MNLKYLSLVGLLILGCDAGVELGNRDGQGGANNANGATGGSAVGGQVATSTATGGQTGLIAVCGNGRLESDETCDDANSASGDGCSSACAIEAGWTCPAPGQACYLPSRCGDAIAQAGEECDLGQQNGASGSGCTADCRLTSLSPPVGICGNSRVESSESCDDGNTIDGDGCGATCAVESGWFCPTPGQRCVPTHCGDGIIQDAEECDDGVNNGRYGGCAADCSLAPRCGDAVVQSEYGEQCDYGYASNDGGYGGCSPNCLMAPYCGDGIKNGPEECDDGSNAGGYGGCAPNCRLAPYCGDGIRNGPEECDSGLAQGDGNCTASCKVKLI
jgi:large repetitive protein